MTLTRDPSLLLLKS